MALFSNGTSTTATVPTAAAYVTSSITSSTATSGSGLPLAATAAAAVALLSSRASAPSTASSTSSSAATKTLFSPSSPSSSLLPLSPFDVTVSSSSPSPPSFQAPSSVAAIAREAVLQVASALLSSNLSLLVNDSAASPPSTVTSPHPSSYLPFAAAAVPPFSSAASFPYASFLLSGNGNQPVADWTANDTANVTSTPEPVGSNYSLAQIILIALVAGFLSLMTVVGNFMVMISFKMDKQLQTISNYFLFSLAVADFAIGLISMPLNTVYLLMGQWPFGALMCDTWLALDYLASNASVLNLLIISFDRYFSVTRPLTYRARRTTKRAIFMISCAWIISLILWPPWIYSWPYIEGGRAVEAHECYIQFLKTNTYITFGTAIAAFYIPVTVMCVLYWQIWRETEKRQKDLTNLQAVKKDNSKRSTSSDDAAEAEEVNKRSRSDSSAAAAPGPGAEEIETTYVPTAMCIENPRYLKVPGRTKPRTFTEILCSTCLKYCKIDREPEGVDEDSTSDAGHGSPGNTTPASVETPVQSSLSHCTSLTLRTEPLTAVMVTGNSTQAASAATARSRLESMIPLLDRPTGNGVRAAGKQSQPPPCPSSSTTATGTGAGSLSAAAGRLHLQNRTYASDSVFTILIRLPLDTDRGDDNQPTIQMIAEEEEDNRHGPPLDAQHHHQRKESPRLERTGSQASDASTDGFVTGGATSGGGGGSAGNVGEIGLQTTCGGSSATVNTVPAASATATPLAKRRISQPPDTIKLPLNTKLVPKQVMAKAAKKKKKKTQERKQDRKAAKTLSAILLAFIITWTPYNVMVLVQTLATCGDQCIPRELWDLVYYLCYINSTVNPLCYALCNASFRRTYVRILTCKWHTKSRNPNRGYYN